MLHCIELHCTALHCTVIYCTALHCTTNQWKAMQCFALPCSEMHIFTMHCSEVDRDISGCVGAGDMTGIQPHSPLLPTVLYCPFVYCTAHCIAVASTSQLYCTGHPSLHCTILSVMYCPLYCPTGKPTVLLPLYCPLLPILQIFLKKLLPPIFVFVTSC